MFVEHMAHDPMAKTMTQPPKTHLAVFRAVRNWTEKMYKNSH